MLSLFLPFKLRKQSGPHQSSVRPMPSLSACSMPFRPRRLPGPTRKAVGCLRPQRNCRAAKRTPSLKTLEGARFTTFEVHHRTQSPSVTMFSRQALLRSARTVAPQRAFLGQTRAFAAPAASERVQPPVALFGLDGTYATALVRTLPTTQLALRFGHCVEDPLLEGLLQALNCLSAVDKVTRNRHN